MSDNPAVTTTTEIKPASPSGSPVSTPPPPTTNRGPPPTDITTESRSSTSPPPRSSPRQRESPIDPRVVALRALFPDYEDVILQSVLESVNWNQDRAVDTLLTMSDPDYKPEPQIQRPPEPQVVLTQEELDEQFARQLIMQEQQQHSQWAASQQGYGPQSYHGAPNNRQQPVQHQGWGSPPPQQSSSTSQGPGMAEFQEQVGKIAETGKRTFGNIFNKVKAKIQEFEAGRPAGSPSPPSHSQWAPGPASYYGPPQTGPTQAQPAYYNPNQSPGPSPSLPTAPVPPSATRPVSSPSPPSTTPRSASPTVSNVATPAQPTESSKLRLPPKQPINLMSLENSHSTDSASSLDSPISPTLLPSASAKAPASMTATSGANKGYSVDDDNDDLEYAENPFDDRKK